MFQCSEQKGALSVEMAAIFWLAQHLQDGGQWVFYAHYCGALSASQSLGDSCPMDW
jgi:hypothetical protein